MKRLFFLFAVSVCSFVHAQQPPALPPASRVVAPPGVSVVRPEYAPPGAPPATTAPNELRDLIRAQSEAIRVLSGKVDSLDERLRRIESKLR
jgi:hypothetical protein